MSHVGVFIYGILKIPRFAEKNGQIGMTILDKIAGWHLPTGKVA
jgi:hypothetical protein